MSGQILIVDDHELVRSSIRSVLSSRPDWKICGEAADGIEAIEKARSLRPDIILMDISMPRMNGLEATRAIHKELPGSSVVIVTQNDPAIARRQAKEVNAAAFVAKSNLVADLLPTLERLAPDSAAASTQDAAPPPTTTPEWLAGGGELGRLIGSRDWSQTSLGPIDAWPQSLKTSVNLILNARHPMWISWGKDAAFLYNDAYIQVLSLAKHPGALGKPTTEVWPEIWDIIGPLIDKVYQKGEASFQDDVRFLMNRGDFIEETYYSFSYSPIRDESGAVAGLFCPTTEVTPKIINARRLRTLSELSSNALLQRTIEAACASVAATLTKNPEDVPFAVLYLIDSASNQARLEQTCGISTGVCSLTPHSIDLSAENSKCLWPLAQVARSAQSQVVSLDNIEGLPLGLAQQRLSQAVVLPVTSRGEGGLFGVLVAGVNAARKLDVEYRTFYELTAGQIATAIQNARAAEEERKRIEALAEIDRAKTAFFSNVSHEFRTPLTLMLGPVEELLARSHTDLSPAAKRQLELVNRNGTRLLRLVNTLLDFSRLEAGRMQAIYLPTDLAAFTIDLASVFRSATERGGTRARTRLPQTRRTGFCRSRHVGEDCT
jgi:CheY-like chemotaxis protein